VDSNLLVKAPPVKFPREISGLYQQGSKNATKHMKMAPVFVTLFLYKSLFTENTVASKKHSSASINTNKAKTTTKSITVVDTWYWSINKMSYNQRCSPNLIVYYNFLQNWQKPFTVEMCRNINLSCFLLRSQLGRSVAK